MKAEKIRNEEIDAQRDARRNKNTTRKDKRIARKVALVAQADAAIGSKVHEKNTQAAHGQTKKAEKKEVEKVKPVEKAKPAAEKKPAAAKPAAAKPVVKK